MTKNVALAQVIKAEEKRKADLIESIGLPPKPRFRDDGGTLLDRPPTVPLRLSELSDDDLMQLFVSLTRWSDYFGGLVAIADVEERSASLIMEKAKALALLKAGGGGRDDRVTYAKAAVAADEEVSRYEAEYESAHARRRFAAVHFEATERDTAVVSRELTRRTGRQEVHERRTHRWAP